MNTQTKYTIRVLVCVAAAALAMHAQIDTVNDLTQLRLAIPLLEKEVRLMQRKNERLEYEVERFESPVHLMELARKPEYGHLHYPRLDEVIVISKEALFTSSDSFRSSARPHLTIACSSAIAGAIPSSQSSPSETSRLTEILFEEVNKAGKEEKKH